MYVTLNYNWWCLAGTKWTQHFVNALPKFWAWCTQTPYLALVPVCTQFVEYPGIYSWSYALIVNMEEWLRLSKEELDVLIDAYSTSSLNNQHNHASAEALCSGTKSEHRLRPRPDLVLVPGHCALTLKGMFRHRGALSFVSICVLPSCHHCNFKSQGNMGKTWHWWNLVQTSAWVRCLNTTFGERARTRVLCSSFCTGTTKMLRSHWCPCPSTEPGHQVWTRP